MGGNFDNFLVQMEASFILINKVSVIVGDFNVDFLLDQARESPFVTCAMFGYEPTIKPPIRG